MGIENHIQYLENVEYQRSQIRSHKSYYSLLIQSFKIKK